MKKLFVIVWLLVVGVGVHALMVYKGRAGASGQPPREWPVRAHLERSPDQPTLVMFAHPKCPCTKASIGELETLLTQANGKFGAVVVFNEPQAVSRDWSQTRSVAMARAMPGVRVILDEDGKITRRFKVETSGHTLIYSSAGRLLFSGGITGSRGHLGENAGADAALELVQTQAAVTTQNTAVFGCGLFDSCSEPKLTRN